MGKAAGEAWGRPGSVGRAGFTAGPGGGPSGTANGAIGPCPYVFAAAHRDVRPSAWRQELCVD